MGGWTTARPGAQQLCPSPAEKAMCLVPQSPCCQGAQAPPDGGLQGTSLLIKHLGARKDFQVEAGQGGESRAMKAAGAREGGGPSRGG